MQSITRWDEAQEGAYLTLTALPPVRKITGDHASRAITFLGHLLERFDLEFFGVTLRTLGISYLGLIMRLGGV